MAGGVHGANRLGGNALADTQVFGKRAGEQAGKVSSLKGKNPMRNQVDNAGQAARTISCGATPSGKGWNTLKLAMWEGAGIFRTAAGLEKTMQQYATSGHYHLRAKSPENLTECCTAGKHADNLFVDCPVRPFTGDESRGAHVRKDIAQAWLPETSPFGHTYISRHAGASRRCRYETPDSPDLEVRSLDR